MSQQTTSTITRSYFTGGPAKLPEPVKQQISKDLFDYNGLGIGVMEMSHRSKEFDQIINEAEANLRKLMNIPENYEVLFMHGGAKTQFDSIPMNLCSELKNCSADYLINGNWSHTAASHAEKYIIVKRQNLSSSSFNRCPSKEELQELDDVCYRYYCDNETIHGIEYNYVPVCDSKTPLVSDMTSNFLSRPIDVEKFGLIYAGAQKNSGIAGLSIVVVRKDLIGRQMNITPTVQSYQVMQSYRSLYNTPPTFAIYVANLCYKWMLGQGGLEAMDKFSKQKSQMLYNVIDGSDGFYINPVDESCRSRMNIVFRLNNKDLETKFFEESTAAGLYELRGHRSTGGMTASLYHGVKLEDVQRLAEFMTGFKERYANTK